MRRTTLTLDDDVSSKLESEARRSGRPFRTVVNETLRRGLAERPDKRQEAPFQVRARDLGDVKPGLTFDNIGHLLEQIEGPLHR